MQEAYPKVLFVTPCAFNRVTGGGVTFSHLFEGWPKDRLAAATEDPVPVTRDICNRYFFLTPRELHYIRPFSFLSRRQRPGSEMKDGPAERSGKSPSSWVKWVGKRLIGEAGIPDRGRLSDELKRWVEAFSPGLLYTILGSPGYMDLVLQIQAAFKLPLVIHLMDEGVTDPRRKGLFGAYLRGLYKEKFSKVLERTKLAMGICDAMAEEYSRRYGVPFVHFQNPVDVDRWHKTARKDVRIEGRPRMVYVGAVLKYAQYQSLLDCCHAVKTLYGEGMSLSFDIFTPKPVLRGLQRTLEVSPAVTVHDVPGSDEEFFSLLASSDVLLLPVNFDARSVHFVRLSMPTKVPSYLTSGTPVLVYGPAGSAQVEYARKGGWGLVVEERGVDGLAQALRRIVSDLPLRQALSESARAAARENHDARKVRTAFQGALVRAAGGSDAYPAI